MSASLAVTFDPDPSRSPHTLVAFGSGLAAGSGAPQSARPRRWARVTVFTGGANGFIPARDAVKMLAPILSMDVLRGVAVDEAFAPAWARACASNEFIAQEKANNTRALGDSLWGPPAAAPLPPREPYQLEAAFAPRRPSLDEVFARVRDYARRYGAHPDFRARDLPTVTKVNNYIASTYGEALPAATLEAVRARLAAEL